MLAMEYGVFISDLRFHSVLRQLALNRLLQMDAEEQTAEWKRAVAYLHKK